MVFMDFTEQQDEDIDDKVNILCGKVSLIFKTLLWNSERAWSWDKYPRVVNVHVNSLDTKIRVLQNKLDLKNRYDYEHEWWNLI